MNDKLFLVKTIWSDKVDDQFIDDFCFACNSTFGGSALSKNAFIRKYIENIYGSSVLCVCYDENNNVAGARALWRNDICSMKAYQPCDTCVLNEYRRHGLFRKMTEAAISFIDDDSIIYNYPNNNSRPLYLNLGWDIYGEFKPRIWHGCKAYTNEHPEIMNDSYFEWWFNYKEFKFVCIQNRYFLVREYGRFFYIVIAEITSKTAKRLSKAKIKPLLYWSSKSVFYNRNKESKYIVFKNGKDANIPIWRMDALS